ncbi:MAG: 1-acyl-sn-glycerol-3-phosphate acyltransferase [Symploca sp. SIO3C6]|uniref:1-acyl-sn-glycerol-3-phosphate acyltransferase n=1 Tax=Symploca sp. SIO1C4 TaxID=2607765 RepID=A0A6B3NG72_9CYAN|nr:1-acyl-sn-glycerol-3-phosphate acyltransferase [Symploca sp. SIO3C6]NER29905.1 1-acyl-sn-glycerol-3-phosphate acyltransferase [Symploca sp. SIO1C4]NET06008.1 1-acyl-sn-glycerol-3-phosphate acyltransferase [Symploca sp. SIO2B6]NET48360.1 1-acyl-sn-glycerol-3-phosphate acyltransferase [Merismopedia sp. SIO2A8]
MIKPAQPLLKNSTLVKATPFTSGVSRWLKPMLYFLGRRTIVPFYFRRLQITGQENIPKTGPVLLAPTHRSRWDGLLVGYAAGKPVSGRDLRFMVTVDECQGLQGWLIQCMGGFPVDANNPRSSIRHSVEILGNGEALVIFPEGGIFQDGQIHSLKPGMARIALQVESSQSGIGVQVLPISIRYSHFVPHWGCDAKIVIGEPLEVAKYTANSTKKGAQQLTDDLQIAMRKLDLD